MGNNPPRDRKHYTTWPSTRTDHSSSLPCRPCLSARDLCTSVKRLDHFSPGRAKNLTSGQPQLAQVPGRMLRPLRIMGRNDGAILADAIFRIRLMLDSLRDVLCLTDLRDIALATLTRVRMG